MLNYLVVDGWYYRVVQNPWKYLIITNINIIECYDNKWLNCYHYYPAHAAYGGYKNSKIGRESNRCC